MKIDFELPIDGRMHRYCMHCRAQNVDQIIKEDKTVYHCNNCNQTKGRALYFNTHKFWIDASKELWHESAGVFVRNRSGKYLFFQRSEFPLTLTIPAGHVDNNEAPDHAAARELKEEVGIDAPNLEHLGTEDNTRDSCSAGADAHRWHSYFVQLDTDPEIRVEEEGGDPVWLTYDEALQENTDDAIKFTLKHYQNQLR